MKSKYIYCIYAELPFTESIWIQPAPTRWKAVAVLTRQKVVMVINVVVKTAIYFLIYLFTYLFIGKFVSGAWLKLFFEALCFGLRQTQKKKKSLSPEGSVFYFPEQLQTVQG